MDRSWWVASGPTSAATGQWGHVTGRRGVRPPHDLLPPWGPSRKLGIITASANRAKLVGLRSGLKAQVHAVIGRRLKPLSQRGPWLADFSTAPAGTRRLSSPTLYSTRSGHGARADRQLPCSLASAVTVSFHAIGSRRPPAGSGTPASGGRRRSLAGGSQEGPPVLPPARQRPDR